MQQLARSNGPRRRYAGGRNRGTSSRQGPILRAVECGSSPTSSEYQENTRLDAAIDAAILIFGFLLVALLHLVAGELRPSWWAFGFIATSWAVTVGISRVLQ